MKNQEKLVKVIEWLYVNDNNFRSRNEWRMKFIAMLKDILLEESPFLPNFMGQEINNIKLCTCNKTTGGPCIVHPNGIYNCKSGQ